MKLMAWWHRKVLGHDQRRKRVSVPGFDPGARGVLIYCDCGSVFVW